MGWSSPPDSTPRLHVSRLGHDGPPVVLLHGLGASGRSWRLTAERLRDEARLICPDLLGFGRSPRPAAAYSIDDHLAALNAALDRVMPDGTPVLLAGHSTGAVLALAWAAARPARFLGVVLMSLPVYQTEADARACIGALSPLARASVGGEGWGELACGVMCVSRPVLRAVLPVLAPGVPADIARDYVMHDWVSYRNTLENVLVHYRLDGAAVQLATSGLPVRLLHGDRDRVAPAAAARALAGAHRWPLALCPSAEHHLPVRQPGACAAALRAIIH